MDINTKKNRIILKITKKKILLDKAQKEYDNARRSLQSFFDAEAKRYYEPPVKE